MRRFSFGNRTAAFTLAAALLLSCLGGMPAAAENADGNYAIGSREEFLEFAAQCESEEYSRGKTFTLTGDIDLSSDGDVMIPVFAGTLEGGGYTIKGLDIVHAGSNMGLFRYVSEGAVVANLRVEGRVRPGGSGVNVGGIAGSNQGTIRLCEFAGEVSGKESTGGIAGYNGSGGVIEECQNEAMVTADLKAGGITGYNEGYIGKCYNWGQVNTQVNRQSQTTTSDMAAQASGNMDLEQALEQEKVNDVGGIAGFSMGRIEGSINYGETGCAHTGYNVGGIAGRQSGIISGCANYGTIQGRKDVGGILGQLEPWLSVTYGEDTLNTLEDQLDALGEIGDQMSRILEEGSDTAETNLDQIGNRVDDIRDVGRFYKELLKSDKDDFADDMDPYMDSIDDILNNLELKLVSKSSKDKVEKLRQLEDREKVLRQELNQGYTGDPLDIEARRQWLERERQILQEMEQNAREMASLTSELSREMPEYALSNGEEFADDLDDLMTEIQNMTDSARKNLEIADDDAGKTDEAMTAQIDLLSGDVDALSGGMKDSKAQIRQQKQRMEEQLDQIQSTISDGLERTDEKGETLFEDISDETASEQAAEDGTVERCGNEGVVSADHQGGGIVGMIGTEVSLDPEQDLDVEEERTLNVSRSANALVRFCVNRGEIDVKYDCAGGIAGKTNLGTLAGNQNYGDVEAGGQYAGGIAGSSGHVLRQNYSRCAVDGKEYVGGIAGWACDLYENGAMADIGSTTEEWLGSIAGAADEEAVIQGNCYVDEGLGAVDGVTRTGQAQGLSYEEFTAMEQVPEEFGRLSVSFLADGQVLKVIDGRYGEGIDASEIPQLPQKEGFYGQWEDKDLSSLHNSVKVHAVYHPWVSTIACSEDKLPLLLAEGEFYPGTVIEVEEADAEGRYDQPGSAAGETADEGSAAGSAESLRIPSGYEPAGRYSYRILTEEQQVFDGPVRLHALAGDKRHTLYAAVVNDGAAELVESKKDGSYLVFDADGAGEFVLLEKRGSLWKWLWLLPAAGILAALAYRKAYRKKTKGSAKWAGRSFTINFNDSIDFSREIRYNNCKRLQSRRCRVLRYLPNGCVGIDSAQDSAIPVFEESEN